MAGELVVVVCLQWEIEEMICFVRVRRHNDGLVVNNNKTMNER